MLEPFYFGDDKSCFGHYTAAEGFPQQKSVLIVPSIFGEAMRAHRITREVTKTLSSQGYDVLRFDFDGDGNSCNETNNISVQDWIRNIQDAYAELVSRSNSSVSVFATRFGAGLSLVALNDLTVESTVLWDPILSNKEMYDLFIGAETPNPAAEHLNTKDPFTAKPMPNGFFETGLGENFATGFLQIGDIVLPEQNLQIIETQASPEQPDDEITPSVCRITHHCDWQKKDLPVIFAPKLISAICENF